MLGILISIAVNLFVAYFLYLQFKKVLNTPPVSGPGSIVNALGFLAKGEIAIAILFYVMASASKSSTAAEGAVGLLVIAICAMSVVVGLIASNTDEDTASMNCKIAAVIGFIPHALICFLLYSGPGSVFWKYTALPFLVVVFFGSNIRNRLKPKMNISSTSEESDVTN